MGCSLPVEEGTIRTSLALLLTGALAAIAGMGLPTPNEARAAVLTVTFAPIADTYVRSSSPASTFGTKTSLRARGGSTTITSYLKFTVTGLTGPVASAKLRLVVTNPSVNGGTVYPTSNVYAGGQTPWTETGLRWSNAPPASGAALSSKGAVATGEIVELDLGTAITGNGTFSFMLTSPSSDYVDLSSKEGPNAPQLVVTQQAGVPTVPQNTSPPTIVGTPEDGQTLTADSGTWTGSPSPTFTYQWLRCDDDQLASCSTIGATTQSYMLVAADVGKRIRVEVTGTNSGGSDTATSDPTAPVTSPPPTTTFTPTDDAYVRSDNPTSNFGSSTSLRARGGSTTITSYLKFTVSGLSGPATAELRLYVSDPSTGTMSAHTVADTSWSESTINWTGAPAIGSLLSSAGSPMSGVWIPLDLGTIPGGGAYSFAVTSSSSDAVWYASSESSNRPQLVVATSGDGPPVNTSPPMISGLARQGQTLSADVGAWTSSTPIAYGYQWQRCIGTGGSCSAIAGATGSTYVLAAGDVGSTIRVIVTATNAAGPTAATSGQTAVVAPPAVVPTVETDPVPNAGDAADDPAIWIHPSDPALSTVIGTDKAGGIAVYDLAGRSIQYRPDGQMNNVDIRPGFALGGESVALVTAGNRSNDTIAIYRVDIPTRTLVDVAARTIQTGIVVYGSCMYQSPAIGKYYVVVTSQLGEVEQWELFDDGSSKVDARKVRSFTVGSQTEGCVADDELGHLYLGEERVGIWKYGAEPDAGTARTLVDSTGAGGHLVADVEGLTIAYGPSGTGYLIASSQGSSSFVVYRREGANEFVKSFVIESGNGIDAVSGTDGIDVTAASIGPAFPGGLFVAQDGSNDAGNQNFKLVPWESVVGGASDPVIAAAGDIACSPDDVAFNGGLGTATACRQRYTSDLLLSSGLSAVLTLGDNQYDCGSASAFAQSYDPAWGRVKAITYPASGNHEYQTFGGTDCDATAAASGYYGYFGAAAGDPGEGYYSFDLGSWHLVALNSECAKVGGCQAGSRQEQWLRADLAAHTNACTLAYWHRPRFSSGVHGNDTAVQPLWEALYDAGADVILNGHDHDYERFAPQAPGGSADAARGIREFVVGTGGTGLRSFSTSVGNSEVRNGAAFGVLRLTLHPTGYDWAFTPEAGSAFTDSGSDGCH